MTTLIKQKKELTEEQKQKNKIYLNEWRLKNGVKVCSYRDNYYLKRLEQDPEYREKAAVNSKARRDKLHEITPPKVNGRPRIHPIKTTTKIIGRPRKYNIISTPIIVNPEN